MPGALTPSPRAGASRVRSAARRRGRSIRGKQKGRMPGPGSNGRSKYLQTCAPAISGQGGHTQTAKVTNALVVGYDLDDATALSLLLAHYNPRCQPEWSEKELLHKVQSIRQKPHYPQGYPAVFGYLLTEETKSHRGEQGHLLTEGAEGATTATRTSRPLPGHQWRGP